MKKIFSLALLFISIALYAQNLKVIGPLEIKGLEPNKSGYIFSRLQIAETLVTIDKTGNLRPNLAESWEQSEDGLTWTFNIKEGIKFHDNTNLTAQIVANNLNRDDVLKKSILRNLPIKNIKALNNSVIITLDSKVSILPAYFVHYSTLILSENSYKNGKLENLIGTGAFKIVDLTLPIGIKATKFKQWWGKNNEVDNLTYTAVGKNETRALMIKSGEADIAFSILPISLKSLNKNKNLDIQTVKIFRTRKLKLNSGDEILNDVNVRKAISYAINRKAISKGILLDETLAATQMFPPELGSWYNNDIEPLHYDLEKSKELLKNSGWEKKEDGFLYKDGKKLKLEIITYPDWPELPIIATAIQNQLKQVGIDLKVSITNSSEVVRRHKDNTLQFALISKNFTLVPNPLGTIAKTYGENGDDWGAMNWENQEMFDTLKSLYTKDDDSQKQKVTKILNEELPAIPVTWSSLTVVSKKNIKNLKVDSFEISYNLSEITFK